MICKFCNTEMMETKVNAGTMSEYSYYICPKCTATFNATYNSALFPDASKRWTNPYILNEPDDGPVLLQRLNKINFDEDLTINSKLKTYETKINEEIKNQKIENDQKAIKYLVLVTLLYLGSRKISPGLSGLEMIGLSTFLLKEALSSSWGIILTVPLAITTPLAIYDLYKFSKD